MTYNPEIATRNNKTYLLAVFYLCMYILLYSCTYKEYTIYPVFFPILHYIISMFSYY